MATNTDNKDMTKTNPPPYVQEKIDYKARCEEQVRINDDLNNLYRQAEDELVTLRAEVAKLKAAVPKPEPKQPEPKQSITAKDVRAWCRNKYGNEWHKEDKDTRKGEAKKALKAERE
jgi:hypothetical protein